MRQIATITILVILIVGRVLSNVPQSMNGKYISDTGESLVIKGKGEFYILSSMEEGNAPYLGKLNLIREKNTIILSTHAASKYLGTTLEWSPVSQELTINWIDRNKIDFEYQSIYRWEK